jgi:hypothetical protein
MWLRPASTCDPLPAPFAASLIAVAPLEAWATAVALLVVAAATMADCWVLWLGAGGRNWYSGWGL